MGMEIMVRFMISIAASALSASARGQNSGADLYYVASSPSETDLAGLMLRPSTGKRLTYLNVPVAWLQIRPAASPRAFPVKASVAVR